MPSVVAWLRTLRDQGPQRRASGGAGASAQSYGLTDYWVRDKKTGKELFLGEFKSKHSAKPGWWTLVDFQDGLEAITPAGRKVLDDLDQKA